MMFKNPLNPVCIFLSGIGLFLSLIGCQPTTSQDVEVVGVTKTIVNEQEPASSIAVTATPASLIAQTATTTWTPAPSATVSPTSQPTLTSLPADTVTSRPWPTLPPDEADDKVLALLADNQNPECLLPCWWGAIPGQTQWPDIEPFLRSFASEIKTNSSAALVYLPLHESIKVPGFDSYVSYSWNESGIISEISVKSMNISGYDPSTMMSLYGVPDEVWLTTLAAPREGVLPFQLIIVYQQQGISFRYYVDATRTGEIVTACFEPGVEVERPDLFPAGPRIYVWDPGDNKGIHEISPIPLGIYYPLEEKTDLTPRTLYEKFTNPNEPPCIDTQAELL